MCVIHTSICLLCKAEDRQTTKINAKDKANQTPLLVHSVSRPLTTNNLMPYPNATPDTALPPQARPE